MAKKKSSKSRRGRKAIPSPGKVRLELRYDEDLFQQISDLADAAQVSVNQLLQGIARWAIPQMKVGEPYRDESGSVRVRPIVGVVFAGEEAYTETYQDENGVPEEEFLPGKILFTLDFTERRVVRDDGDSTS